MPTTTNKGFEVPTGGSYVGTWDHPVNANSEDLDSILGGVTTVALTNVNVTLSASQMKCMGLKLTGTLTGNVVLTFTTPGFYFIDNQCTGAFVVTIWKGSGKACGIPPGEVTDFFNDGTDWRFRNLARTGAMEFWYTSTMPAWVTASTVPPFLCCDGATFSAVTYPALNAFLGGTTLPDMRSYVPIPLDDMGTAAGAAGRIGSVNTGSGTIVGATLGSSGGSNTQTITQANLPVASLVSSSLSVALSNASDVATASSTSNFNNPGGSGIRALANDAQIRTIAATVSGTVPLGGSGTGHNNIQLSKMAGIMVIKT